MRPKYPHLLFSFLFFFLKIRDFFMRFRDLFMRFRFWDLFMRFRDLIQVCSGLILFDLHQWWTVTIRRRRRLTQEIVGSGRTNDAEFIGVIGFIRFTTDRHRSDDEDSRQFEFCFVSLSTQLENENEHFGYNDWHSTNIFPVVLPVNSSVGGGTSIEAPSMELGKKEEEGEGHKRK